jgi:hypothetical protein
MAGVMVVVVVAVPSLSCSITNTDESGDESVNIAGAPELCNHDGKNVNLCDNGKKQL